MQELWLVVLAAPLLAAALVLALTRPLDVGLPAFAASIPFGGLLALGSSPFTSLSSILGLVTTTGLLLLLARGRVHTVPLSATVPIWLLVLGTAGATVLWSLKPSVTVNGLLMLFAVVTLYVLVAIAEIDRSSLARTEAGLILGGLIATGYGLVQLLFLGGFPGSRFGNDMLGPNNEAVALLLPMVLALHRSLSGRTRSRLVMYRAAAAVLLLGVLMTGSRGGVVSAAAALVVLTLAERERRRTLVAFLAVGATVATAAFAFQPFGLAERTVEVASSSGRVDIWRVGLAACPQYCWTGSGWDTFPDVYAATQPSVPDAAVLVGKGTYEPHNIWLLMAIELGIAGLLLLSVALFVSLGEAFRLPGRHRGPPLAGFVGTVVAGLFLSSLASKFVWMSLILIAMTRSVAWLEARRSTGESGQTGSQGDAPVRHA